MPAAALSKRHDTNSCRSFHRRKQRQQRTLGNASFLLEIARVLRFHLAELRLIQESIEVLLAGKQPPRPHVPGSEEILHKGKGAPASAFTLGFNPGYV